MTPQIMIKAFVLDVPTVALALSSNDKQVLRLVEDGKLLHAWDLRANGQYRGLIRVAAVSVADYQAGRAGDENHGALIASIFPGQFPNIQRNLIARKLNCSMQLLDALVKLKELQYAPGAIDRQHPAKITRASLVSFLHRRRA